MTTPLRLATRGSALARAQAALAQIALRDAGAAATGLVIIETTGDRRQEALAALPGQGWFTGELEAALLEGRADVAVHSAKDLPTSIGEGLLLAAHLPRADPRDALLCREGGSLSSLPAGSRVGTSSPRRIGLLRALRPDLEAVPMRGNVDTRLGKLDRGEVDALLLACAGLDRLGLGTRITERLDPHSFVPAPAQGVIALQARADTEAEALCREVNDGAAAVSVRAERAVLRGLGGGCLLPLGAWARMEEDVLVLIAALAQGGEVRIAELDGDPEDPEALGARVAEALR